jgi:hypothetical protein
VPRAEPTRTEKRPESLTCRNSGAIVCPRGDTVHTHTVPHGEPEESIVASEVDVSPPAPLPGHPALDVPTGDRDPTLAGRTASMVLVRLADEALRGVVERTGSALGIAFSDQLLHGWDLARATKQDPTMPDGLAEAAYDCIHGRFTEEQRKGVFGPEIPW